MMKTLLFIQREIEKVVVWVYIYSYVCELQNVSALSPLLKSVFDASLSLSEVSIVFCAQSLQTFLMIFNWVIKLCVKREVCDDVSV